MDKDINRIKVVLAEKKGLTNGWRNSWAVRPQQYPNGVPIHASLRWKHTFVYQNCWKST